MYYKEIFGENRKKNEKRMDKDKKFESKGKMANTSVSPSCICTSNGNGCIFISGLVKNMKENEKKTMMRTDLALEVRESFPEDDVEIKGVVLEEEYKKEKDIRISTVMIKNKQGQEAMGKPIGTYITIEAPLLKESDENYHKPLAEEITKYIDELSGGLKDKSVLIVGLGNREATPDSLGPRVVDNLFVTRHLIQEFGSEFQEYHKMEAVSAIAPGVMAQTGMETREILKGIIQETKPDLIVAIDALAARSANRLNKTIQITDTGICPGSGVGNNRKALNEESLGVKVIALGVPTVIDAATIVSDRMEEILLKQDFDEIEVQQFLSEINHTAIENMFVTPKNIDEAVKRISFTISETLNACFYRGAEN